jgi:hypothetical protein
MFAGHVIAGNWASITVTVNEQLPGLPTASVVEQLTVVTPLAKVVPEAGVQIGVFTPGQLSVAVAGGYETSAVQTPGSVV